MSATVREIVDDALQIVGEASGVGVQTFTEDRMKGDVVRAFNILFKKYPWHQYRQWSTLILDGVLGIITTDDLTQVIDFDDFLAVHRAGSDKPLPILSRSINPGTLTGTSVQNWTALPVTSVYYAARKLQFWPKAAIGSVDVHARIYPVTTWAWDSVMYLDKDMLVFGTAYMTLSGDDLNPGAAEANRVLMEMRYRDIVANLSTHPTSLSGGSLTPTEWS